MRNTEPAEPLSVSGGPRYVAQIEGIRRMSRMYSEDSGLALVNIYRNELSKLEIEKDALGNEVYISQKRKIESEIAKLMESLYMYDNNNETGQ